jgi:hypothetical protein
MLTAAEGIALHNSYQGMYSALSKAAYNPPELPQEMSVLP